MLTEQPMCARTGNEWWWPGPTEPCRELATQDDHIVALADGGDLHDPENRQGLCTACHAVKSAVERSGRG